MCLFSSLTAGKGTGYRGRVWLVAKSRRLTRIFVRRYLFRKISKDLVRIVSNKKCFDIYKGATKRPRKVTQPLLHDVDYVRRSNLKSDSLGEDLHSTMETDDGVVVNWEGARALHRRQLWTTEVGVVLGGRTSLDSRD